MQVTGMNGVFLLFFISPRSQILLMMIYRLSSDDQAIAAGWGGDVVFLAGLAAGAVVAIATAGSAAVKLDAVALAGDAISLTGAGLTVVTVVADGADGAWGGAV